MTRPHLTPYEVRILRECAGVLRPPSPWDAALGAAIETLRGHGLLTNDGRVTQSGDALLRILGYSDKEEPNL